MRGISIHEAYTGLDRDGCTSLQLPRHFNPRGLYRPRRLNLTGNDNHIDFNPRGLYRPRHGTLLPYDEGPVISIHEAYTGLDTAVSTNVPEVQDFNPRGLYRPRPP